MTFRVGTRLMSVDHAATYQVFKTYMVTPSR
jgi:hypothetical protein